MSASLSELSGGLDKKSQRMKNKMDFFTQGNRFYDGAYAMAKRRCGAVRSLPFCVVGVLRHGLMEEKEMQIIRQIFEEFQKASSTEKPFFCHLAVYDDLSEIDKVRCKRAISTENGETHFPTYAVTAKETSPKSQSKYMGEAFYCDTKNLRAFMMERFEQAAHYTATKARERGDRPWWFDPIQLVQQAKAPEEEKAVVDEESRQIAYQEDMNRRVQEAMRRGKDPFKSSRAKQNESPMDAITRGMARVLSRDPEEEKKRDIRRRFREAVEMGDEKAAKLQIYRACVKDIQVDILKELMMVDTENPEREAFVERITENIEKNTKAFVERLEKQYLSLSKSIERMKKEKGEKRKQMAKMVAKNAEALKGSPLWLLQSTKSFYGSMKSTLSGEASRVYNMWQSGAGFDYGGFMGVMLQSVMPDSPLSDALSTTQRVLTMTDTLSSGVMSLSSSLYSMSLRCEMTNKQFEVMSVLTDKKNGIFGTDALRSFVENTFKSNPADNAITKLFDAVKESAAKSKNFKVDDKWLAGKLKELVGGDSDLSSHFFDNEGKPSLSVKVAVEKVFGENARSKLRLFESATEEGERLLRAQKSAFRFLPFSEQANAKERWDQWTGLVKGDQKNWAEFVSQGAKNVFVAFQMYSMTSRFIDDACWRVGFDNKNYKWLKRSASLIVGLGSPLWFPSIAPLIVSAYTATFGIGYAASMAYGILQFTVTKSWCYYHGDNSETCKWITEKSEQWKKTVQRISSAVPYVLLAGILGESAAAYFAGATTSNTILSSLVAVSSYLEGVPIVGGITGTLNFSSAVGMKVLTGITLVGSAKVLGALAIGGILWKTSKYAAKKLRQYTKTRRHLLSGGRVVLPEGWHMWADARESTLWFGHTVSGRIQDVFPTKTEFVDSRGRRVADMTIEFGVGSPTKGQRMIARELADSIGDEPRTRRALSAWIKSRPRPGAKLLAEQLILKRVVGDEAFEDLRSRKRLSGGAAGGSLLPPNAMMRLRVLSDGKRGASNSTLGLVGAHATYHDVRSLLLL